MKSDEYYMGNFLLYFRLEKYEQNQANLAQK